MIIEAPTERGRQNFSSEVLRCQQDDDALQELAELYKDYFIRVCASVLFGSQWILPTTFSYSLQWQRLYPGPEEPPYRTFF